MRPVSPVGPLCISLSLISCSSSTSPWSDREAMTIASLSLDRLETNGATSNKYAFDPKAAQLGRLFFYSTAFSSTGTMSCATCHVPDRNFTDSRSTPAGGTRNTPTIVGAGQSPWQFWDGRQDSLWAQALEPLESAVEHNMSRGDVVGVVALLYRDTYESVFGELPSRHCFSSINPAPGAKFGPKDRATNSLQGCQRAVNGVFANVGKAIEAYVRSLSWERTRFDQYAQEVRQGRVDSRVLNSAEVAGLRIFVGKGSCVSCHFGPLLSNHDFHATGLAAASGQDLGRASAIKLVLDNPFNCKGLYSDASEDACAELAYARTDFQESYAAFKTPTLRGLVHTAPYAHDGRFQTLEEVVRHYARDAESDLLAHSDVPPIQLSNDEVAQLVMFLHTLDSGWKEMRL